MGSSDPSDAENWRSVYLDLMSFKHHIISETRRRLREIAAPARAELRRDLAMLEGELGRLVGRYDYWAREARERTARRS